VTYTERARRAPRRIQIRRIRVAGLLVVIAAIAAALGGQLPASSPSTAASPTDVPRSEHRGAPGKAGGGPILRSRRRGPPGEADGSVLRREYGGRLGEADGAVPDGTTVFDDEVPGVAKLDPALLSALRQAATDAADDGVQFVVDSGWRSAEYQEQLLREAIAKYGSQAEAARWVATPTTSPHVSGDAVDIGPSGTAAWLSEHGAEYGLCRIYGNEPWHFELRPEAVGHGCPALYADPTHDPRMQQR
jgi:zinc D-Ala-D-Ala carboxypeptidase